jgi:enoyl-CoA hydratase
LGGTVRLQQTVSPAAALTMILGGDTVNAEEALRIGLVDHIFPREELFSAGIALLRKMTRNRQPEVIHSVMKALRHSSTMTEEEAMREETRMFCKLAKKESERRSSEQS